uniref:hypothetical protein n=1 Tax=Hylemonella sp. TaxID=2066020 RepID=UPI0035B1D2EB
MAEHCRLCGENRPLLLSHILPAFVFRWKRESSGGSHLRSTEEPNLRVQDGLKMYWLCAQCEERFSKDEREFATRIFYPYLQDSASQYPYGPWMLRFCASVSWRLVRLALEQDRFKDGWTAREVERCREAELVWREFLMGERTHPGEFRQHLLPLDVIEKGSRGDAPNINRYLTRMIQMDLCRGSSSIFTFAKLGRFIIFGMIQPDSQRWIGTKVNANGGEIGPRSYQLPRALWDYMNQKARDAAFALSSVSERQQSKIDESFRKNIDGFIGSDAFRAMDADVSTFGDAVFSRTDSTTK